MRSLAAIALLLALPGCVLFAGEEGAEPAPEPGRCAPGDELVEQLCRPGCGAHEERDAAGDCVFGCVRSCEGKACLQDDGCDTPCETGCVVVTNVTSVEQEPALRREHACLAWDEPSHAFLLQGGRRDTLSQKTLGPQSCRLAGGPDELMFDSGGAPLLVDGVPSTRAQYCGLPEACWTSSCELSEAWLSVDACHYCFLADTWQLSQEADGSWRWRLHPDAPMEPAPSFSWAPRCVSAGADGVLARGPTEAAGWSSWRFTGGKWQLQTGEETPPPVALNVNGHVTWEPGCTRPFGCEAIAGGCEDDPGQPRRSAIRWIDGDGVPREAAFPAALWRQRVEPAAAGVPGGAYYFGGTSRIGGCYAPFLDATSEALNDLLYWDGRTLARVEAAGSADLSPREEGTLAVLGDRLVLFGGKHTREGSGTSTYPAELCEFQAARGWACRYEDGPGREGDEKRGRPTSARLPRPRSAHALASGFDAKGRPVVVLFGGSEQAARGDTWVIGLP